MLRCESLIGIALISLSSLFFWGGGAAADVVSIQTGEDTAPYSFLPNLSRYNNASLYAFQTVDDETGAPHDFETYLRFDVTSADIPAGQILDEAFVVLTYAFDFTGFGDTSDEPGILDCHEILEPWNQTTLTWSNRPAIDTPFDSITDIMTFGALICDATPIVAGWLYEGVPNHGVALTSPTARVMGMNSFEAAVSPSVKPTLLLTTEVPEPGFALSIGAGILALRGLSGGKRRRRDRSIRPGPLQ